MRKNTLNVGTPNQLKLSLVFSTSNPVEVRSLQYRLDARGIPSLFRYSSSSCEVFVLQRYVGAAELAVSEWQGPDEHDPDLGEEDYELCCSFGRR